MSKIQLSIAVLMLALVSPGSDARDAGAIWDSRCEECHGDPKPFARKYLWNIEGQLQGQHHINNMDLFMRNHYIPEHEIEILHNMMLAQANSPVRFEVECGECHGAAQDFVEKSLWVRGSEITGLESGLDIKEFLPGHQRLQAEDIAFYTKLFVRIADSSTP